MPKGQYLFTAMMILAILLSAFSSLEAESKFQLIGNYQNGIFDESAAEIGAYDDMNKKLFVVNGDSKAIDIIDMSDPTNPTKISSIDVAPYGSNVNSVAVFMGIVAAAVEADPKQNPGKAVFFAHNGAFLGEIEVGALPDMITFSSDGLKVLTANEGEPSDDYSNDPLGSVSIIDFSGGVNGITVNTVDFTKFNDKKEYLRNKGVRIFGLNATVAQDIEPEFIALNHDNTLAYVTCQENNALAVIDLETPEVIDIYGLGVKDHSNGRPWLEQYYLNELPDFPELGTPVYGGETVMLGGFSCLYFDRDNSSANNYIFYAVPDRGPNASPVNRADVGTTQNLRPFKLPEYQARIVKFRFNPMTRELTLDPNEQIMLYQKDGTTPISGRGNIPGFDEIPVTYTDDTHYPNVDYSFDGIDYHELEYDPYGGDFEGIVMDPDGNFWLCDEYRPAIYKFGPDGVLIERYVPKGASQLGDTPQPEGYYGAETLPEVYNKRRANRGFEAIAYDYGENVILAFIQSPMYNPNSSTKNKSDVIRVLGLTLWDGEPIREWVYLLERNEFPGHALGRVDKIGDAVYIGNKTFLVLERDSSVPGENEGKKYVYAMYLEGASDIYGSFVSAKTESTGEGDKTLEMMSAFDLAEEQIQPVFKRKVLNLPSIGYLPSDKPEGIAYLPDGSIAVLNDNDFGLAGAGVSDNSVLGIIGFGDDNGLDASDKDDMIDIRNWPVFGMYLPDGMASYYTNGKNYYFLANEGDARDYEDDAGYIEEDHVKDLELNMHMFDDYELSDLQKDENLGRLKVTNELGDLDNDGNLELLFSFGGRSFSVLDEYGNMIYDSGNEIAHHVAEMLPDNFNSTNDENDSFDNRSDDKGAEPEGIEIGKIGDRHYAFVCLERVGGFVVYDITDIHNIFFVEYVNNRNFDYEFDPDNVTEADLAVIGDLGPEDLVFIPADKSPNDNPLLVVTNEVSGSVSIYQIDFTIDVEDQHDADAVFDMQSIYPNPFSTNAMISFYMNKPAVLNINIYDESGARIASHGGKTMNAGLQFVRFNGSSIPAGLYFVKVEAEGQAETTKIVKLK